MKKHIYLNLKRFDVSAAEGGVNRLASSADWAKTIMAGCKDGLNAYSSDELECAIFWPELHVLEAAKARAAGHSAKVGCQSVAPFDVAAGVNFGAMTTLRSAKAMRAAGTETALIGHCEERKILTDTMRSALVAVNPSLASDAEMEKRLASAVSVNLVKKVQAALEAGLNVVFCIGESLEQRPAWQAVLAEQLEGLAKLDKTRLALAYEPIWAIGPGKTPPGSEDIQAVAKCIKSIYSDIPLVYGGGLKQDNAAMLASIPEIDGGLIALTRFSGDIGFYPEEFIEIIGLYMEGAKK